MKGEASADTSCDLSNVNESGKKFRSVVDAGLFINATQVPKLTYVMSNVRSVMRRWLGARTEGSHLKSMMFATIRKRLVDDANVEEVATEFCVKTEQRRKYFGMDN